MSRNSSIPLLAACGRIRLRTSLIAVLALAALVMTGCGEPDDGDDGGGGYLAQEQSASWAQRS